MSLRRLRVALRHEALLAVRYRIVHTAVAVAIALVGVLAALPAASAPVVVPLLLFMEAATIGLFLVAGLAHYERDERTAQALEVTPLQAGERLAVRVGLLTALALVVGLTVTVAAATLPGRLAAAPSLPGVVLGLSAVTVIVLLTGALVAVHVPSITSYIVAVQLALVPLALPILPYLGFAESPLWWALPSHGALVVLGGAVAGPGPSAGQALAAVAVAAVWGGALSWLHARRRGAAAR